MPLTPAGVWEVDHSTQELWVYSDSESYAAGDEVRFSASASQPTDAVSLRITRDGLTPAVVHVSAPFAVNFHRPPERAFAGCGWPVALRFRIPDEWPSGFYIVEVRAPSPARP